MRCRHCVGACASCCVVCGCGEAVGARLPSTPVVKTAQTDVSRREPVEAVVSRVCVMSNAAQTTVLLGSVKISDVFVAPTRIVRTDVFVREHPGVWSAPVTNIATMKSGLSALLILDVWPASQDKVGLAFPKAVSIVSKVHKCANQTVNGAIARGSRIVNPMRNVRTESVFWIVHPLSAKLPKTSVRPPRLHYLGSFFVV